MFQGEPIPKNDSANRPIRLLPFALAAALTTYLLMVLIGFAGLGGALAGSIAGGWTLGRMMRRG